MLRVGITGGIGSGKSTVAALFAARGVTVIDADVIAHELSAPGGDAYNAIVAQFGAKILDTHGQIDRKRLRAQVFSDPNARQSLEAILHPRIRARMRALTDSATPPYCILVIPLLIETGQRELIDRILVVDLPEAKQVERVMARSGLNASEVQAIMATQATRTARLAAADDVVTNDRDNVWLEQEVARLHSVYAALGTKG